MTKPLTTKAQHTSYNVILFINLFFFPYLAGPLYSLSREMKFLILKIDFHGLDWHICLWINMEPLHSYEIITTRGS